MSKTAPTYVFTGSEIQYPQNWQKNLLTVADLLGKIEQAEIVIRKREAETQLVKEKLQAAAQEATTAMIRVHASEELRLYGGPGGQVATIPCMGLQAADQAPYRCRRDGRPDSDRR